MKQNILRFASIRQSAKADIINILVIIAIWAIMVILVNPVGDFPLNDDWAYGQAVKSVVEKGDFQLSDWTATNLFSQVYWGALFCVPFGFSFTALRFSTLTLGLIGVLATYGLLREVNSNQKISLFGALLVAINPIYFGLSNTFMTDVPFFAFATLSLYFLLRGLKHDSNIEVTIGIFISCVAILNRQVGLAIPLAFGCAYLMKKGVSVKSFIQGFFPTFLGLGIQIVYQKWLQVTMRLPASYNNQVKTLLEAVSNGLRHVIFGYTEITLISLVYLGIFIFPFLILLFPRKFKELSSRNRSLTLFGSAIFFTVVMGIFVSQHRLMPLAQNILINFGLGPIGMIIGLNNSALPKAPTIFLAIITAIGVVGAALLIKYLFFIIVQIFYKNSYFEFLGKKWLNTLIISAICIYIAPLGALGLGSFGFYDRYLIFLLPLLMMTISVSTTNISNWNVGYRFISTALIMMLLYGGFTIGATHDYLSWNRVRWQALRNLMQEVQISPNHIDGGMEFNGWYLYDSKYKYKPGKSWWWVDKDDYVISFAPLAGYEEVKRYPFRRWVPFGQGNIFVLHKNT